jgi:hypothetical protein
MNRPRPNPTRFGACLLAGLVFLTGCGTFHTEMGAPVASTAPGFVEGQTRVATVIHQLGPPGQVSRLPDGFAFLYEHSTVDEFQLGFSVDIAFLRFIKFVKAWNSIDEDVVLMTFDDRGILRSAGRRQWKESLGGGSAAQLVFAAISLSDASQIVRPADAHSWGEWLLQPLPAALNSGQDLHTGEHGLQQRIAPDYAGQETLEMTVQKTPRETKKANKNYTQQ